MSADGIVPQTGPAPAPLVVDGTRAALDAARDKAMAKVRPAPAPAAVSTVDTPTPATITMDPAALKQLTKQAAALRRAEARVAELEAGSKDVGTFAEAKALYAAGKRLEAIAKLSGNDPSAEMEALMGAYLDTTPAVPVDPQQAKLEALEKAEADRTKRETDAATAAAEEKVKAQDASIQGFAWSVLDAEKLPNGQPKFGLCARPKNRFEAATAARHLVVKVYAPKDHPNGDVTPDQARALFAKAFAQVEQEYEARYADELGERFVRPGHNPQPVPGRAAPAAPRPAAIATPTEPTGANQSPTLSRAAISTQNYPKSLTPAQATAKAIERIKSLRG